MHKFLIVIFILFTSLFLSSCQVIQDHKIRIQLPIPVINTLNPFLWNAQSVLAQGTLFEGLFGFDSTGKVIPKLVDQYSTTSDHKTWTLRLKSNLRWSNGDPLDARDFMYSWIRQIQPGQPAEVWAAFLLDVDNALEYKGGAVSIDQVGLKLIDSLTIQVRLKFEMDLRPKLALATAVPLHQKAYEKALAHKQNYWAPENLISNGPYLPYQMVKDQYILLRPNPHYAFQRGLVDEIVLKMGGEQVEIQSYEALDLDLAFVSGMGDYKYVTESPHLSPEVYSLEKLGFQGFQMARTINPLLENLNLRKALAFAADRQTIAHAVLGDRVLPTSFYGPPSDTMLSGLKTIQYNMDSARTYLQKSGYPLHLEFNQRPKITFFAPPANDFRWSGVIEVLQASWHSIGVNVEIENMENLILDQYTWGGGYRKDPAFTRPGLTMYTGEMLWPNAIMQLRLADHTWYYQNFPYNLKNKLKNKTLEADDFPLSGRGEKSGDWKILDQLTQKLALTQESIIANEPESTLPHELIFPNYKVSYERIKALWSPNLDSKTKIQLWLKARQLINEGEMAMLKWSENQPNQDGWRKMTRLYRISLDSSKQYIRDLQQTAINQAWIIPLYTEKLVYLKRPWLKGVVINRYGKHIMAYNLQYLDVDTSLYWQVKR